MLAMNNNWPGTDIRKSEHNHFTLCYDKTPHGYVPGLPAKVIPRKPVTRKPGGFAAHAGTIAGMGPKAHQTFTINRAGVKMRVRA